MKNGRYSLKDRPVSNGSAIRTETDKIGFDLLSIRIIRKIIEWKAFPSIFQLITLAIFIALIFIGWQIYTPQNVNDKLFAKTNLVTLVVWGIWWPVMIWLSVTMGRVWCMICPLEFVSNITERLAVMLRVKQKRLSGWIRNGAVIVLLYSLIQLLVVGIHLHRVPAYTSFFLIGLLSLSILTGFFFRDRAFCRGFCPICMLLNVYGRGGILSVRAGSLKACAECAGKDCVAYFNRGKFDARSCPSLLIPPKLNSNKDCLVCTQCLKSCNSGNMRLALRAPFHSKDAREEKAGWALTFFVMIVSGFVTSELTTEWKAARELFLFATRLFSDLTGINHTNGFIEGFWALLVFPLLLWTLLGIITWLTRGAASIFDAWRRLAFPLVIIISAGHLTKAVAKFNSWVSFLPLTINDPYGKISLQSIATGINAPGVLFSNQIVSIIGLLSLSFSLLYSIREEKLISGHHSTRLIPKLILFMFYSIIVIGIGL